MTVSVPAPERAVTITSAGTDLAGVLTLPSVAAGPVPAALILPGSGQIDRDGNHRRLPLGISRAIAESLALSGVASLRYDKRGVGESGGDFRSAGLSDTVADARAALEVLRAGPGIDPDRVFLVGHSEGAIVATQLAPDAPVAGVVLISGIAVPAEQMLAWQTRQVAATLPRPVRVLLRLLRQDLVRHQARNVERLRASTGDVERIGLQRVNARWHRELLAFDPRPLLAATRVPVLAVTGAKDLQVDPADLRAMQELVPGETTTHLVPDLTHILRRDPHPPSLSRYRTLAREPVDAEVLRLVTDWVLATSREQTSA